MSSNRFSPSAAAIVALFLLASCAQQPLSSIDRAQYKTVALTPEIKAPAHYIYRDLTGKRARGLGGGGLIGALIGAASEGPGYHRFDAAASKNPVEIRAVVRRSLENSLRTSQLLKLVPSNADTTMKVEILGWGAGPVNGRALGGVVMARVTLTGRNGTVLWKKDEWATSNTTVELENLEANPRLWPHMVSEAADALARKLILVTATTRRSVAEPFM